MTRSGMEFTKLTEITEIKFVERFNSKNNNTCKSDINITSPSFFLLH